MSDVTNTKGTSVHAPLYQLWGLVKRHSSGKAPVASNAYASHLGRLNCYFMYIYIYCCIYTHVHIIITELFKARIGGGGGGGGLPLPVK